MEAIALLAPGFLITYFRNRYISGRMKSISSALLEYLIASSIYYVVVLLFLLKFNFDGPVLAVTIGILLPMAIGICLGAASQMKWLSYLENFVGLNAVTPYETGWDGAFCTLKNSAWVSVHTKSMGVICGKFTHMSVASTDLSNKDIFLEYVFADGFPENGINPKSPKSSMWISADEIIAIEFNGAH